MSKRLIKKNEFIDGFNHGDNFRSIYKNPTSGEISKIRDEDEYNSIRGVIYSDGTSYIWSGSILHDFINKFDIVEKIDVDNSFRFAYEPSSDQAWIIDVQNKYTVSEANDIIKKNIDFLSKIGDTSKKMFIHNSSDQAIDFDEDLIDIDF